MPETNTDTEREEFEAQLQTEIRYLVLQDQITLLSGKPLMPKGKRMLEHYIAERDLLRLAGMDLAEELFV